MKLYHGSEKLFTVLKPTGVNTGNRLQKAHWAIYFWDDYEKARKWAIFQYLRRTLKQRLVYNVINNGVLVTKEQYKELLSAADNGKCYVYEADIPRNKVGFGSSPEIDEYTVRQNVTPQKVYEHIVDEKAIYHICTIATQKEINDYIKDLESGKFSNNRGFLLYLLLDPKKDQERHGYNKRIKEGTLKPGDELGKEPPSSKW